MMQTMNTISTVPTSAPAQPAFVQGYMMDYINYTGGTPATVRTNVNNLKQLSAWLKYQEIGNPMKHHIDQYRDWLLSDHPAISFNPDISCGWNYRTDIHGNPVRVTCKPGTVRGYLQTVKAFFKWTAGAGLYPDIAAAVTMPRQAAGHKRDFLTAEEVVAVESSIAEQAERRAEAAAKEAKDTAGRVQRNAEQGLRLQAMYQLAVNAGLRTIEISRARVCDLESKGGQYWIYIHGKGYSAADQRKQLAPEVYQAIRAYLNARKDGYTQDSPLFVSTGNHSGGKAILPTTISTMLKKAMQEAGYDSPRLTAHSLRHTTGQAVMEITSNNVYETQMFMRHQSPKTTEVYLENENQQRDDQLARQLYRHYHGGSGEAQAMRDRLQILIDGMSDEQIAQLVGIAQAIAK